MQTDPELPVRVGVYDSVEAAEEVVSRLRSAGFDDEQLTIVCSNDDKVQSLRKFEHQHPAGTYTSLAAAVGGAIGAAACGLAAWSISVVASGDLGVVLASSALAIWTGAVLGGLIGSMLTRGVEKEVADYYQQALERGKILVAVEDTEPDLKRRVRRLEQASRILERTGSHVVALPEG